MQSYKLRPHHALCTLFYEGKGYSESFCNNMMLILDSLQENPLITITAECDTICLCCPNNQNGRCTDAKKVRRYDEAVLSLTKLQYKDTICYQELHDCVMHAVLAKGLLRQVCGDCCWFSVCQKRAAALCEFEKDKTLERACR